MNPGIFSKAHSSVLLDPFLLAQIAEFTSLLAIDAKCEAVKTSRIPGAWFRLFCDKTEKYLSNNRYCEFVQRRTRAGCRTGCCQKPLRLNSY